MLHRVKTSLKKSIQDGFSWGGMFGLVEIYMVPFALTLGASTLLIGVLRSLPILISSLLQVFSEFFVYYFKSCKKVIFYSVLFQAISLFLSSFAIFLPKSIAIYFFIIFIIFYSIGGSMAIAPWYTLMGEYLPSNKRGEFFGFRNRIIGISYFGFSFIASFFLNIYGKYLLSFFFIFISASIFRFFSAYYITFMYESNVTFHIPKTFSGLFFSSNLKENNENKDIYKTFLSIFILVFSTYMAAPYFSVYILKDLKFNYLKYMILSSIGQFLTWMIMKNWGLLMDKKGTLNVLKYAFYFIPLVSLLWLFSKNFYYLTIVEIFSGIAWAAFAMGSTNIVYEFIKPSLRTKYNSHLTFILSFAQFLGAIIGGVLYEKLKFNINPFLIILVISTIGRFFALNYFIKVKNNSTKDLKLKSI